MSRNADEIWQAVVSAGLNFTAPCPEQGFCGQRGSRNCRGAHAENRGGWRTDRQEKKRSGRNSYHSRPEFPVILMGDEHNLDKQELHSRLEKPADDRLEWGHGTICESRTGKRHCRVEETARRAEGRHEHIV